MPSTPQIAIAAVAGVVVLGGAVYLAQNHLWSGGIHAVDLRNAPINVVGTACADPQLTSAGISSVPLHDGTFQLGSYHFGMVGDVRYGEISGHTTNNAPERAVFVGSCSTGDKTSQVLFVYGMENGKPVRVAASDLSNGGSSLVESIDVADGAIAIKQNEGDPPSLVSLSYALLNGALVNLGRTGESQSAESQPAPAQTLSEAPQAVADTASGEDRVNFASFRQTLAPYGAWIQHPRWGAVWHPTSVPADFRPYREGHWENAQQYGTVWVSDYPWGDIAFHYGRWGYDPGYGWLWQPGYVWSPAWVVWRAGAGNIGWFPIPPGYYDATGPFVDNWAGWYGYRDLSGMALDAAAFYALWSFIPAYEIYAPGLALDVIPAGAYAGFIGRTAGWTRFGISRGVLVNRAIDGARFREAFGRPLPASVRHDFLLHHGPIVGVEEGHLIARGQPVSAGFARGPGIAAALHHPVFSHYGPGYAHHITYAGHGRVGTYGGMHAYPRSTGGYAHPSVYSRPPANYARPVRQPYNNQHHP